jgi:hypothetical protein
VPPAGADKAIAVVDDQLKHRAAFLVNGVKRSAPVGPAFDKPRGAIAFVRVLNGDDPASRSSADSDSAPRAGFPRSSRDEGPPTSEAPDPQAGVSVADPAVVAPEAAAGVRTCEVCGGPLPAGSRSHRRTDTSACRRALARREANADRVDALGVGTDVPLSRPSDAATPDPTPRAAPGGGDALLSGSARGAEPEPYRTGQGPAVPTLVLL